MNKKEKSWWEKQKNGQWKILTDPLKNNPEINSQFNNFITNFYWKFREKKGIENNAYPEVKFLGFKEFEDFSEEGKMGHCKFEAEKRIEGVYTNGQKTGENIKFDFKLSIFISQKYLLDRLGMDKWLSSEDSFYQVGFNELIETIAHELAHAYQQTVNNFGWNEIRSQCESSGDKVRYPQLVAEHTTLTNEIKQMMESSAEYQEFRKWWRGEKSKKDLSNQPTSWQEVKDSTKEKIDKVGDASAKATKKAGEGIKNVGEKLSESADENRWPRWVLPIGIVIGVLFLIGIIVWVFKPKK